MIDNAAQAREHFTAALLGLQDRPHVSNEATKWYAWFSELGYCPLRAALKRAGIEKFYPLDDVQQANLQLKMEVGTRVADIIQQQAVAQGDGLWTAEHAVVDHDLGVSGKIDLVEWAEADSTPFAVYEIKTSMRNTPNIGAALQVLGYKMVTGARYAFIIMVKPTGAYTLWSLAPNDNGYLLIDENGQNWDSPLNSPAILCYDMVKREIAQHRRYLKLAQFWDGPEGLNGWDIAALAPHSLADADRAWMCVDSDSTVEPHRYARKYTTKDGTVYQAGDVRPGRAFGSCEWFCHGPYREIVIDLDENDQRVYSVVTERKTYENAQPEE